MYMNSLRIPTTAKKSHSFFLFYFHVAVICFNEKQIFQKKMSQM